jgi:hypothetical protein
MAFMAVFVVIFAFVSYLLWLLFVPHHLATLPFGNHKVRITIVYNWDVSHNVRCELRGPKCRHPAEIIAFVGAAEANPAFTVHQSTNRQVFWITAQTFPKMILYAVDLDSGAHWSAVESDKDGESLLKIANDEQSGYKLYDFAWIGVKNDQAARGIK